MTIRSMAEMNHSIEVDTKSDTAETHDDDQLHAAPSTPEDNPIVVYGAHGYPSIVSEDEPKCDQPTAVEPRWVPQTSYVDVGQIPVPIGTLTQFQCPASMYSPSPMINTPLWNDWEQQREADAEPHVEERLVDVTGGTRSDNGDDVVSPGGDEHVESSFIEVDTGGVAKSGGVEHGL